MGNLFSWKCRASVGVEFPSSSSSISSPSTTLVEGKKKYLTEVKLGKGKYGKVYSGTQLPSQRKVALKILSDKHGRREEKIFEMLQRIDPEQKNLLPLLDSFALGSFKYCLVFPRLDANVAQYMARRNFRPVQLSQLRPVAQQLLVALGALKSLGVVHADIKPDNIMFVDEETQPSRVMLVDFGLARTTSEMSTRGANQVISHRAPEVLLGLPGDEAIDMWAVGCVIARMFIGTGNLFPGHCPYECIRAVVRLLGQPSDELLETFPETQQFFALKDDDKTSGRKFRLLTQSEYVKRNNIYTYQRPSVYQKCRSIDDLPRFHPRPRSKAEGEDMAEFMSLLKLMLSTDQRWRVRPEQGLQHSFITMGHLSQRRGDPYVTVARDRMSVCRGVTR